MRIGTHEPSKLAAEISSIREIEVGFRIPQVAGKVGGRAARSRAGQGIAVRQV
jgi:hypothetical protein